MLAGLTPEQWAGWEAYDAIEPLGTRGVRELLAILAAHDSGESPESYLPAWERSAGREQTGDQQRAEVERLARTHNAPQSGESQI